MQETVVYLHKHTALYTSIYKSNTINLIEFKFPPGYISKWNTLKLDVSPEFQDSILAWVCQIKYCWLRRSWALIIIILFCDLLALYILYIYKQEVYIYIYIYFLLAIYSGLRHYVSSQFWCLSICGRFICALTSNLHCSSRFFAQDTDYRLVLASHPWGELKMLFVIQLGISKCLCGCVCVSASVCVCVCVNKFFAHFHSSHNRSSSCLSQSFDAPKTYWCWSCTGLFGG